MKQIIKKIYYHFLHSLDQSFERNKSYLSITGFVIIVFHLFFYFFYLNSLELQYQGLPLRIIGITFAILAISYRYWPVSFKKYSLPMWFIGVTYILPFFFSVMLFRSHLDLVWLFGVVVMLFLSFIVLGEFFLLLTIQIIGLGLGIAYFIWIDNGQVSLSQADIFTYILIYAFAFVVGYLYLHLIQTSMGYKDRLEGMMTVTSNIAHELRTPLLSVKSGASGVRQYLPLLLEAYKYASAHRQDFPSIRISHIEHLEEVLDRITKEVDYSNNIIDMMLINARGIDFGDIQLEVCSIVECVDIALKRYMYQIKENDMINWAPKTDFKFLGVAVLVVHVVLNLLKNAIYFIRKAEKGKVHIWLEAGKKFNYLHFKDTGTGISEKVLPYIFERFYTTTSVGTGIGLTFSREIMEKFGGDIKCCSKEGEFTEFVLSFPVYKQPENRPHMGQDSKPN